ncbi:hypothetical protein ACJX0J_018960, partial [Zea mays]
IYLVSIMIFGLTNVVGSPSVVYILTHIDHIFTFINPIVVCVSGTIRNIDEGTLRPNSEGFGVRSKEEGLKQLGEALIILTCVALFLIYRRNQNWFLKYL